VLAGDITRYVAGKSEYADFCVDRNSLVIEEMWYANGGLIRRHVATHVKIDPPIDPKVFAIEVPRTPGLDPGSVEKIDPKTTAGLHLWALPHKPKGFEALGRYAVTVSSAAIPQAQNALPAPGPNSTTDVYVRGPDLLVIDQGASLTAVTQHDSRPKRRVKLRGLRNGVVIIDGRMSEVRGETKDGSVVRVFGTLPPSQLLKFARELRPTGV
jgi:hypothetical protein